MLYGRAARVLVVEVLGHHVHQAVLLQLLRRQDAEADVGAEGGRPASLALAWATHIGLIDTW